MKKQKIIFLGKLPPPYIGPALATEVILNSKLKEEFELIHLDTSDHRDINTLAAFDLTNFYLAFKQYWLLFYYIIKYKPVAVYIPNAQTTVAYLRDIPFVIISKLFGKKLIGHLRGGNFKNWYNSSSNFTKWIVRKIHPLFNAQIVLGNNLKEMFRGILPENKIFVVPNGKDYNYNRKRREENIEKIQVLFLANFHKSKGIIDVLNSVKYLNGFDNDYVINFAGSWRAKETKDEFEIIVKDFLPKVNVIGTVIGEEKEKLFINSDIFVFPTYYHNEGHPWVIVEAMASGLPIITTNQGAISESVFDGINGYIVEKQNPAQIAEKLKILIEDKELREKMGKESRRIYLENFTEEKMVEKLADVFRKVIDR